MVRMSFQSCSVLFQSLHLIQYFHQCKKNNSVLESQTCDTTQSRINTPLSPRTSQPSNFLSETPSTSKLQKTSISSNSGSTRTYQTTEDTRSSSRASGWLGFVT